MKDEKYRLLCTALKRTQLRERLDKAAKTLTEWRECNKLTNLAAPLKVKERLVKEQFKDAHKNQSTVELTGVDFIDDYLF